MPVRVSFTTRGLSLHDPNRQGQPQTERQPRTPWLYACICLRLIQRGNIFKSINLFSIHLVKLTATIAQVRVKRLVNLGLIDCNCTAAERITQLKSRLTDDDRTIRELETFFSALGDTTRLKILKIIGDEELCSCEVMAALGLTQPTTSHHLAILERAGLLSSSRSGKWVFYKITNSNVRNLIMKASSTVKEIHH